MVSFFGDHDTTETVNIPFNTFDSNDPTASVTITNLVAGDIEIHKDGGVAQRSSDAGVTVSINFDGVTGNHMIHIDLSDNTDAGFYSAGSRYQVRIEGTTVDGGTINGWVGAFSVGCTLRPTTAGRTLDIQATGEVDANLTMILSHLLTNTGTQIADAFQYMFDVGSPALLASDVMRGTDGANTTVPDAAGVAPTAAEIVNEWETQSQADPTGFHVNVMEVAATSQTANDNGADINAILVDTSTTIPADIAALNDLSAADVNAEVDTALTDYDGPTRAEATSDKDEVIVQVNANETKIDALNDISTADVNTQCTASLNTYDPPTRAEATSDKDEVIVQVNANETKIDALNDISTADVNTQCTASLNTYDPPTRTEATSDKDEVIVQVNANEAKIDIIDTNVDSVLVDTGTTLPADIAALNDITVADILAGTVEGTVTLVQSLRLALSVLTGKVSGGGSNTLTFRDISDTKDRVITTVDVDGNRTAVGTRDGS